MNFVLQTKHFVVFYHAAQSLDVYKDSDLTYTDYLAADFLIAVFAVPGIDVKIVFVDTVVVVGGGGGTVFGAVVVVGTAFAAAAVAGNAVVAVEIVLSGTVYVDLDNFVAGDNVYHIFAPLEE